MSTNKDVLYKKTSTGKYTTQALAAVIQIKSGAVIKPADLNKIIKKSNFDYTTGSGCSEDEYVQLTNALRGNPFTLISPYVFRKVVFSVIGRHIDEDDIDECLKPCLEGESSKQCLSPMQRAFDAIADGSMADFLSGSDSSTKKYANTNSPTFIDKVFEETFPSIFSEKSESASATPDLAAIINDPKTAEVLRNVRGIAQLMGAESAEIPNVVAKASKELFGDQFFKLFTRVETAGCADVEVGEAVVKASVAKGGVTKTQAVEKEKREYSVLSTSTGSHTLLSTKDRVQHYMSKHPEGAYIDDILLAVTGTDHYNHPEARAIGFELVKLGFKLYIDPETNRYSYRPSKPIPEKPISTSDLAKLLRLSTVAMNHELIKHGFLVKSDCNGNYNKIGPAGKAYHVVDLSTSKRMWKPSIVDVVRKLI